MSVLVSNNPVLTAVPSARPVNDAEPVEPLHPADEASARAALIACLDAPTPDPHRIFASLNDFTLHFYRRKPERARQLLEMTILLGERWFGAQVKSVAIAHMNAATIALDSQDADACTRHAALAEAALDTLGEFVYAAHAADMLGSVAMGHRRFLEASTCYGRALARLESQFGTGHARTRAMAARLARAHASMGDTLALILLEARYGTLRG